MDKETLIKIIAVTITIILITNLALYILNKVKGIYFWGTLAITALIAYKGIPCIRKHDKKRKNS